MQKKISILAGIIIIVVVAVILFGGVFAYQHFAIKPQQNSKFFGSSPKTTQTQTAGWKTYTNTQYGFSFQYPSIVSLKQNGETITLSHSIAYKHNDFCNLKGGPDAALDKFTDFNLSFKVYNQNLKDLVQSSSYPGWDYVSQNPFKLDSFSGFKVTEGVEGCGKDVYYLAISSNKTLLVENALIPEFTPLDGDYKTYLNLPGIIPPTQEGNYFNQILSTLKFTK